MTTVEIIDEVTQKSQESSERIVQLVDEARETNEELVHQGEQLRGVKRETEDIREDLKDVEEQVSRLECFTCGLFRCSAAAGWWRRRRKRARPRLEFNENPVVPPAGQQTSQKKRRGKQYNKKGTGEAPESPVPGQGVLKGSIIRKVTNDEIIDGHTSEVVAELAEQQGAELEKHNRLIDDIKQNVDQEAEQLHERLEQID